MATSPPPLDRTVVPSEIDRSSWGAFLLNWIWGVGNNTFIALLTFIPFFGLVKPFVLGAKGSSWAWRNGRWDSIEHFQARGTPMGDLGRRDLAWRDRPVWRNLWRRFLRSREFRSLPAAVSRLQANTEAVSVLGAPISTGIPSGEISTKAGGSGQAKLNYSVTGTKAKGALHVEALKKDGVWSLKVLKLKIDGRDDVIDLLKESKV